MVQNLILIAERKWLQTLEHVCTETFLTVYLPSHNQTHHLRVWQHAKNLLLALNNTEHNFTQQNVEALLIAIMFHDQGLSITLDEKHGYASREICKTWLSTLNNANLPENTLLILDLIEQHENKNYNLEKSNIISLYTILAAADDADAFGPIGIYRYAEIYLMRNIEYAMLAEKVLQNAKQRFLHIENLYGNIEPWFTEIQMNYHILNVFYSEILIVSDNTVNKKNWVVEVLDIFKHKLVENHALLIDIVKYYKNHHSERLVKEYFKMLYKSIA